VYSFTLLDLTSTFNLSLLSYWFSVNVTALEWYTNYLDDWSQSLTYVGKQTAALSVDCSVPLESVLDPLEFFAYTEKVVWIIGSHSVELTTLNVKPSASLVMSPVHVKD
jgi:hypothetical protein